MSRTAVAALALACSFPAGAQNQQQDKGYWRASNSTAKGTTGDIAISGDRIAINFLQFPISEIRTLTPAEVSALFDLPADDASAQHATGALYRITIPGGRRFLHKNTLCGNDDATWMATYASGKDLNVAIFSGAAMPALTFDALANSGTTCGTYQYTR